ncbi:MAG: glucokinase, partial [Cyanobacteria bacterium]|nr:glucokinase [Cyanobacteriota bacterium]MDW8201252.1 glucokinase [Cyanobacteriota bacterium SKYGB_h_bin112]
MATLLAGDIGGTKTILRLVTSTPSGSALPTLTTLYEQTYPSQEFLDLVPMVRQFLQEAGSSASRNIVRA